MNRFVFTLPFLACGVHLTAQTLTAATNAPAIGDQYTVYTVPSYTDPGSAGAGMSWDFATLPATGAVTYKFIDPALSAHAALFPDAQWAVTNSVTDTNFFKVSTAGFEKVGEDFMLATFDIQCHLSDAELRLKLPCSYGTTWADAIAANYDIAGNATIRSGGISGACDGAGSLIMPYGTVNNVLRVHTRLLQSDQIGFFPATHNRDEWVFMAEWGKFPLLRITSDTISIPAFSIQQVTRTTEWLDGATVGFSDVAAAPQFIVFPNPAQDRLTFVPSVGLAAHAVIEVCDATGRSVLSVPAGSVGVGQELNIASLAPGTYCVTMIASGGARRSQHFVKN